MKLEKLHGAEKAHLEMLEESRNTPSLLKQILRRSD